MLVLLPVLHVPVLVLIEFEYTLRCTVSTARTITMPLGRSRPGAVMYSAGGLHRNVSVSKKKDRNLRRLEG